MTPAKAMEQVTQGFADDGVVPYDINNGSCNEWGEEVLDLLRETTYIVEYWETLFGFADTTHAFLRIDGKFYDAECPEGVDDHMELPIFRKLFAEVNRRQPVWLLDHNKGNQFKGESMRDMTHETAIEYYKDVSPDYIPEYCKRNNIPIPPEAT
jgi:hypothetical protein